MTYNEIRELYSRYLLLGFKMANYEWFNFVITSDDKVELKSLNDEYIKSSKINELIVPSWIDSVAKNFSFNLDKFKGQIIKFDFGPLPITCNLFGETGLKTIIFNGDIVKEATLICLDDLEELIFTKPVILQDCCCCSLKSLKNCSFYNIMEYGGLCFYNCNKNIEIQWEERKNEIYKRG